MHECEKGLSELPIKFYVTHFYLATSSLSPCSHLIDLKRDTLTHMQTLRYTKLSQMIHQIY